MPAHARVNGNSGGGSGSDSHMAGRARQRLKISALGYAHARHGIDTDLDLVRMCLRKFCQVAIEFVAALPGTHVKNRRIDLYAQGDSGALQYAAIAYASARHGVDADVGMAREGLAMLCQEAIDFVESLPKDEPKRPVDPHRQIGHGA